MAPERLRPLLTRSRHLAALATLLALPLTGCLGDGAEEIKAHARGDATDYPAWIDKLYPPPGSETSATQAVQVDHAATTPDRQVRLIIDGTDVTTYAVATAPGLLEYDTDQAQAPISLEPGEHTAVVRLMRVTPGASEGVDSYNRQVHEPIDSFTWTFTVL